MTSVLQLLQEMPQARERLAYANRMTEAAAHEVMGLVEAGRAECRRVERQCADLMGAIERMAGSAELDLARARSILRMCSQFASRMGAFASAQHASLGDILLRQDFQDLSGQVIGKAISLIEHAEGRLGEALLELGAEPTEPAAVGHAPLQGPQVPDKALQQADVDDLLATLGF